MQKTINEHAYELLGMLTPDVRSRAILGGGALRAFHDKTTIKDLDFFFRSEEDYQAAVTLMTENAAAWGYIRGADKGRTAVFQDTLFGYEVNLIGFAFGSPEEHLERFDFQCCRMVAWIEGNKAQVWQSLHSVTDAQNKLLTVLTNNGTERTLRRVQHYIDDYGYTFDFLATEHLMSAEEADEADAEEALETPQGDLFDPPPAPPVAVEQVLREYIRRVPRYGRLGY